MWPPRTLRVALTAIGMLVSLVAEAATDRQSRTVPLAAGRALLVEITVGTVRVEGSDRTDAEIVIEREAPDSASFERLPISIEETGTLVIVHALQSDGTTDPTLRTNISLKVPRAATFERIEVMEGRLTITGFHGQIAADVRRGPIDAADVSGTLRLETGIGSIVVTRATLSATGLLRLRTFNGDVRLSLSQRPVDARILALALNGQITSQIPLTIKNTWGPRWGEATLGRGEPVISIDVVNGSVDLRAP